jgi:hypothetical protein
VDAWAFKGPDGQVARVEVSTLRNGTVSRWEYYEKDALVRAEEDANADGTVDKWEEYRAGALTSVALDKDGDGKADRRLVYGRDGVKVEKLK